MKEKEEKHERQQQLMFQRLWLVLRGGGRLLLAVPQKKGTPSLPKSTGQQGFLQPGAANTHTITSSFRGADVPCCCPKVTLVIALWSTMKMGFSKLCHTPCLTF